MSLISKANKVLSIILKDDNRKPFYKIAIELIGSSLTNKEVPTHYFTHLLYRKDSGFYKDYLSQNKLNSIKKTLFRGRGGDNPNLLDKITFSEISCAGNVSHPKIYEVIEKGMHKFNTDEELRQYILSIIEKNKVNDLFLKPTNLNGGTGCFKVNLNSDDSVYRDILYYLNDSSYLIQEYVIQHPAINKLYEKSINTLRIHTIRNEKGIEVPSALMRFGFGGSVVDNGSKGGIYVAVDLNKKQLTGTGKTYLKNGGKVYSSHPDTDVKFDGYELPFLEEAISLCEKAALLFEDTVIGWDIAMTVNGPTVIEGNGNPHLVMAQVSCGGFLQHEGFYEAFKDYIK